MSEDVPMVTETLTDRLEADRRLFKAGYREGLAARADLVDATEPGPPNVESTPEQFAARWNAHTLEARAVWLQARREDSRAAQQCWLQQHEHRIEEMEARQTIDRERLVWQVSDVLMRVYDNGTSPNARREAEEVVKAVLALVRPVDRDTIRRAVQSVLWHASNYPESAQPHILGQDITPLTDRVVFAVIDALGQPPEDPAPERDFWDDRTTPD